MALSSTDERIVERSIVTTNPHGLLSHMGTRHPVSISASLDGEILKTP